VLRIEPRTKEVVSETSSYGPETAPLAKRLGNTMVRMAQVLTVLAFIESLVSARANRSGISPIRPAYRSSHDYVHVRKGVLDLLPVGIRSSIWWQISRIPHLHCKIARSSE
jgi:hypothetical protein